MTSAAIPSSGSWNTSGRSVLLSGEATQSRISTVMSASLVLKKKHHFWAKSDVFKGLSPCGSRLQRSQENYGQNQSVGSHDVRIRLLSWRKTPGTVDKKEGFGFLSIEVCWDKEWEKNLGGRGLLFALPPLGPPWISLARSGLDIQYGV